MAETLWHHSFINILQKSAEFNECCKLDPGLSDDEIDKVEERFGVIFPEDLGQLLRFALPLPKSPHCSAVDPAGIIRSHIHFPDWRNGSTEELAKWIARPKNEILLAIDQNNFWHPVLGRRPKNQLEAFAQAKTVLAIAPQLIPIYGHRFMPSISHANGPVYSAYGTDIIIYSESLEMWAHDEFIRQGSVRYSDPSFGSRLPQVPFWGNLIEHIE